MSFSYRTLHSHAFSFLKHRMPKASCHEQHEIQQHDSYCISICLVHRGSRNVQTFVFHLSQPCPLHWLELHSAVDRCREHCFQSRRHVCWSTSSRAMSATANERPQDRLHCCYRRRAAPRASRSLPAGGVRRRRRGRQGRSSIVGASPAATPRRRRPSCPGFRVCFVLPAY